jgi:hypothetical protein
VVQDAFGLAGDVFEIEQFRRSERVASACVNHLCYKQIILHFNI